MEIPEFSSKILKKKNDLRFFTIISKNIYFIDQGSLSSFDKKIQDFQGLSGPKTILFPIVLLPGHYGMDGRNIILIPDRQ